MEQKLKNTFISYLYEREVPPPPRWGESEIRESVAAVLEDHNNSVSLDPVELEAFLARIINNLPRSRPPQSHPIACLVAVYVGGGRYRIGWSMCGRKDQFTYAMARRIALGRAMATRPLHSVPPLVDRFIATKYQALQAWVNAMWAAEQAQEDLAEESHHTVTREMALDAGDPDLEGREV